MKKNPTALLAMVFAISVAPFAAHAQSGDDDYDPYDDPTFVMIYGPRPAPDPAGLGTPYFGPGNPMNLANDPAALQLAARETIGALSVAGVGAFAADLTGAAALGPLEALEATGLPGASELSSAIKLLLEIAEGGVDNAAKVLGEAVVDKVKEVVVDKVLEPIKDAVTDIAKEEFKKDFLDPADPEQPEPPEANPDDPPTDPDEPDMGPDDSGGDDDYDWWDGGGGGGSSWDS